MKKLISIWLKIKAFLGYGERLDRKDKVLPSHQSSTAILQNLSATVPLCHIKFKDVEDYVTMRGDEIIFQQKIMKD